jgi:hypothetical protein
MRSTSSAARKAIVGDHDQRVHVFSQAGNALFRLALALATFKPEGLGDYAHGEGPHLLGHLGQDRCRSGAGAAAHAGGDEHQVSALQGFLQFIAGFLGGLLANHRVAAGAQAPSELLAQLDAPLGGGLQQGLGIGVQHPVAHPLQVGGNHAIDRIAAASAHTDHFNARRLAGHDAIAGG